jgi:hypothetical protein
MGEGLVLVVAPIERGSRVPASRSRWPPTPGPAGGLVGADHDAADPAASCSGFIATTICVVEQLGLAMIP